MTTQEETPVAVQEAEQRSRRTHKRRFRRLPRPAIAVKGLLEAASAAELETARERCVMILELWLGKTSKAALAKRLSLPPLRVWQMSQQALSGMIAGLLVQPRTRARTGSEAGVAALVRPPPGPDAAGLRKELAKVKQDLLASQRVNELLKQFPGTGVREASLRRRIPHGKPRPRTSKASAALRPRASRADARAMPPPARSAAGDSDGARAEPAAALALEARKRTAGAPDRPAEA